MRFLLIKSTLYFIELFTLIQTQRTQRYSQRSQRRCREILPLCVLCGLHFATFAFPAYRIAAISLFTLHVGFNAKNPKILAKVSKTLPRDPSLCVLCGPHFAAFAFSADPERIVSFSSFPHWFQRKEREDIRKDRKDAARERFFIKRVGCGGGTDRLLWRPPLATFGNFTLSEIIEIR